MLCRRALQLVRARGACSLRVCAGLLLDMWTRLLSQLHVGLALAGGGGVSGRVDGAVRECARDVFAELLSAQLAEYAAGAEADADDDAAVVRMLCCDVGRAADWWSDGRAASVVHMCVMFW